MRMLEVYNLEKAIAEFNNWKGAASISIDLTDGEIITDVYAGDVYAGGFGGNPTFCLVQKNERQGNKKFGKNGRELLDFVVSKNVEKYIGDLEQFRYDYALEIYKINA